MIGHKYNYDEVFFRDLTICVLDTLEGRLNWVNRFTSGDIDVNVPIYYSMTGDERFLLDSFQDDIVSNNRYVELNTDQIPRGHLTLTNFSTRSDNFRNPNIWLRSVVENNEEVTRVLKQVRAIPITVNYDLTILLKTEIDVFKCAQELFNTLWLYRFMYFEHNYMNIDAVMVVPDSNTVDIPRERNMQSDNTVKMTISFEVQTFYPSFTSDSNCRINSSGSSIINGSDVLKIGNTLSLHSNKSKKVTINDIKEGYNIYGKCIPNGTIVKEINIPNGEIKMSKTSSCDFTGDISFTCTSDGVIMPYRTRWFSNLRSLSIK